MSYADLVHKIATQAKQASYQLRLLSSTQKNAVLSTLADLLCTHKAEIQKENARDLEQAKKDQLSSALVDRLTLNDKAFDAMVRACHDIAALSDPVGEVIDGRTLANGIALRRVRIPLGVVALIFESRPNVTIDVATLCLKSGNAAILRGGREAIHSNTILARLFQEALQKNKIHESAVQLITETDRAFIIDLVRAKNEIDLVVPRGGEALIQFVAEHSLIPVVKHDKGVCHIYIHPSADLDKATAIVINAKAQRPGVCNAAETLLLDSRFEGSARVLKALLDKNVILHADADGLIRLRKMGFDAQSLTPEGYGKEYLSLDISVRFVDDVADAVKHIHTFGSGHSEAIIAENIQAVHEFERALDSSAIFINCSTRFNDGAEFGLGAEVGIATGKLHVRGPMGLRDLTTYKYIAEGDGQIRS